MIDAQRELENTIHENGQVRAENARLTEELAEARECVRQYVVAAYRMRNDWAESDESHQNELWRGLHSLDEAARELLDDNTVEGPLTRVGE